VPGKIVPDKVFALFLLNPEWSRRSKQPKHQPIKTYTKAPVWGSPELVFYPASAQHLVSVQALL
jgi:hypothetical protein